VQDYDVTLKLLLRGSAKLTIRELTGAAVEEWLDVELPKVQNTRVDLLGQTNEGSLVHLELQSGNDATMPLRMAEYCLSVFRLLGTFPRQVLLYVGRAKAAKSKPDGVSLRWTNSVAWQNLGGMRETSVS